MSRLAGKVALVTGAARGLGASIARQFVREGARVALCDVRDDEGRAVAASLGPSAAYMHLDVTNESAWLEVVQRVHTQFGPLTVLVNNAGIYRTQPFEQISLAQYNQVISINQTSVFIGMRTCVPAMREAKGGSIVNIGSTASVEGVTGALHYAASKHAVLGMTKVAALELAVDRIRVNAVCPGAMATPLLAESYGTSSDMLLLAPAPFVPLGRMASPDEVASTVTFLASEESSYTTGSTFIVDGGVTAGTSLPKANQ